MSLINKAQLNSNQIQLVRNWLPQGSQLYTYSPDKGMIWYLQDWSGRPVKNALKLDPSQLQQLSQLN